MIKESKNYVINGNGIKSLMYGEVVIYMHMHGNDLIR